MFLLSLDKERIEERLSQAMFHLSVASRHLSLTKERKKGKTIYAKGS
jgi:hypothetical protein